MTTTIKNAVAAILAPLAVAAAAEGAKREESAGFNAQINEGVLAGYAETIVVIAAAQAEGLWTTGKQKGGKASFSAELKAALEAGAKAQSINAARAKRLVEVGAAILFRKDAAIPAVKEFALEGDAEAVVEAFLDANIKREADLLRHVGAGPKKDAVSALVKAFKALSPADQARFTRAVAPESKPVLVAA